MNTDGNLDALNRRLDEIEEHEARTITCPECEGEGVCAYEEAVADYVDGGYLKDVYDTCETCDGAGEIEIENDE